MAGRSQQRAAAAAVPEPAVPPVRASWKVDRVRVLRPVLEENTEAEILGGFDGQILPVFVRQDSIGGRTLSFLNVVGVPAVDPAPQSQTNYILCYDQNSGAWLSIT